MFEIISKKIAALLVLSVAPLPLLAAGANAPWTSLFSGTNLNGWDIYLTSQPTGGSDTNRLVQVDGGNFHFYKDAAAGAEQAMGYVVTQRSFTNYHLRLEFKWGEKKFPPLMRFSRDSGLLYHVSGTNKLWPDSVECQIQENDVGDIFAVSTQVTAPVDSTTTRLIATFSTNINTGEAHPIKKVMPVYRSPEEGGVLYTQGQIGSSLRFIRHPCNEQPGWNAVEIYVQGDQAIHVVNGRTNNQCFNIKRSVDGRWVPLDHGRIALQLEGAEVLYRRIEIQEFE